MDKAIQIVQHKLYAYQDELENARALGRYAECIELAGKIEALNYLLSDLQHELYLRGLEMRGAMSIDELADKYYEECLFVDGKLDDEPVEGRLLGVIKRILREQDKRTRYACAQAIKNVSSSHGEKAFAGRAFKPFSMLDEAYNACMNVDTFGEGE